MICISVDLPAAIAADDRNALTGINLERHIVKKRNVAVGVRDVLEGDERHAGRLRVPYRGLVRPEASLSKGSLYSQR